MKAKKLLSLLLLIVITASMFVPVQAADNIKVYVNEVEVNFDTEPFIENGRTLVPLRAIFEAMNADVYWEEATQTVIALRDNVMVSLTIGSNVMQKVHGDESTKIALDVPAVIVNGRTYVPVRAIGESFYAQVNWDDVQQAVEIYTNEYKSSSYSCPEYSIDNKNINGWHTDFSGSSTTMSNDSRIYNAQISNSRVYYTLGETTAFYVYDGSQIYEFETGNIICNMLADGNNVYYIHEDRNVYRMNITTGTTKVIGKAPTFKRGNFDVEPYTIWDNGYELRMTLYGSILRVKTENGTIYIDTATDKESNEETYNERKNLSGSRCSYSKSNEYKITGYDNTIKRVDTETDDEEILVIGNNNKLLDWNTSYIVYVSFEEADIGDYNLAESQFEQQHRQLYNRLYSKLSLYVMDFDGSNKKLLTTWQSGKVSTATTDSTNNNLNNDISSNIEPEKACGICDGLGKITCDICGGSGRVSEYDRLTHEKVDKTCRRIGCYGGQIDCPGC